MGVTGKDVISKNDVNIVGDPALAPPAPSTTGFNPDNLNTSTNTPTDNDVIITKESSTWYVKAFSKVWDYIKSKIGISSQGSANKFLNEQGTFTTVNSGKEYDLEFNQTKDEVTLTEDNVDKTTLPLVATFVGTHTEWNLLSQAEQNQYRIVHFTDDGGYGTAYDIPHGQSNVGNDLDDLRDDLGNPSSASSVTGNDAFEKISTLKDALANVPHLATRTEARTLTTVAVFGKYITYIAVPTDKTFTLNSIITPELGDITSNFTVDSTMTSTEGYVQLSTSTSSYAGRVIRIKYTLS